jgi:hypothetical protein
MTPSRPSLPCRVSSKTYDASGYTGIKLWAKGSRIYLDVIGQLDSTELLENGGTCAATSYYGASYLFTSLSSSWKQFTLPISYLTGGTATFKPAHARGRNPAYEAASRAHKPARDLQQCETQGIRGHLPHARPTTLRCENVTLVGQH